MQKKIGEHLQKYFLWNLEWNVGMMMPSAQRVAGDRDTHTLAAFSPFVLSFCIPPAMTSHESNALDTANMAKEQTSVPWGRGEESRVFGVTPTNKLN